MMSRSRFCRIAAVLILAGAAWLPAGSGQAADQIGIQLDWIVRGDHAMFFVAKEKGYFAKNGIEVTAIRKGTGTPDALRLVGNGNAEFGFGDLPTLQVSRSQGVPVVAIVAANQKSPLAMISLAKTLQLKSVADLKGRNIGVHPAGSTYVFLKALLKANGLAEADIKESTVSPPYESYLLLGRVEAVPGYLDAEVPELEAKAGGKGSLSILQGANFGFNAYGSGVFTSEALIAKQPDLVKRFVAAYLQAFRDVIENPDEAVAITVKAVPEFADKREVLREQLQADLDDTFLSAGSKANGIGSISKAGWAATTETLVAQGALAKADNPEAGFDNSFVAAADPLKR